MKKIFIIICALFVGMAYADNTITSKEYVDGQVSNLQTQIPAKNTNTVVMNTGTAGEIGEKAIYDTTAAYGAQSDALVTAGAFNSAMQNALESEFVCVEWQGSVHDNAHCLLYEVRGATQMQALPAGYTQLEYIESTGTQWIDTGYFPNSNTIVELKANVLSLTSDWPMLFGAGSGTVRTPTWCQYSMYLGHGRAYYTYGCISGNDNDIITNYELATQTDYIYTANKNIFTINGVQTIGATVPAFAINNSMYLFARHTNGGADTITPLKMYYVKIWDNNSLVRNMLAARRDSDGKLGMYDTVSNTFFTNSGTGEFIAGPVASYLPQGN